MQSSEFADATLILIGHGSTQNDESGAAVQLHAETLRKRALFAEVLEGFWKQAPSVLAALASARTPRVVLVPLFISEGYFSERAIPAALDFENAGEPGWTRFQHSAGRSLYYARPVGTHDLMTVVILARAREVVERHPFPRAPQPRDLTLFIAGHGTERDANSRRAVERQAALIRSRNLYAAVHAVFMEEDPRIADCVALAKTRGVVVVPFFISDGLHVAEDIPVLLGEPAAVVRKRLAANQPTWRNPTEKHGKMIWYGRAVGTEPGFAEVILERAREAVAPCRSGGHG